MRRSFVRLLRTAIFVAGAAALSLAPELARAEEPSIEDELDSLREEVGSEEDLGEKPDAGGSDIGAEGDGGVSGHRSGGGGGDDVGAPQVGGEPGNRVDRGGRSADADAAEESDREPEGEGRAASDAGFWSNWRLYRDPLLCGLFAGIVLGFLGVYVVSRRIVFVSAALSQVSALGITLGFLVVAGGAVTGALQQWIPPVLAVSSSLIVVFALARAGDKPSFPRDAVLGTAFVVPMALVLVLGPYIPQEMHEIQAILHGSAVVVRTSDLWAVGLSGVVVLAIQIAGFRGFVFASLDPKVARTQGLPVGALEGVLFGSIALMTGLVTRALGALPTFALTVLPAIGALRLEIGLRGVFAVAAALGGLSGAVGYWVAYEFGWSVGAAQTLFAALGMIVVRAAGALHDRGAKLGAPTSAPGE